MCETLDESISKYKTWLIENMHTSPVKEELNRIYLLAKNQDVYLECFCKPKSCHGDIIAEVVNRAILKYHTNSTEENETNQT